MPEHTLRHILFSRSYNFLNMQGGFKLISIVRKKMMTKQERAALFFLLPSFIILSLFVFWPIVNSFILSFYNWSLLDSKHPFIGLDNYEALIKDERFLNSVYNTVRYTVVTVPLSIIFALGLALLVNERLKGVSLFKAIYFLPVISSFAVISIIWSFLMDPDIGLLVYYANLAGFHTIGWLRSPVWAMPAVILVAVWKNIGFNMVIYLAGLQAIPVSLYEAAALDGANKFRCFWHVTLQMLRHTTLFVIIITVISSFQVFDQVYVMTRGGPLFSTETIVYYIYHHGIELLDMGYASAASWLLFLVIFAITLIQLRVFKYSRTD